MTATAHAVPYPDELRSRIDAYLQDLRFSSAPDVAGLQDAMRYSLLAGGKRIRPVLALATAEAVQVDPEDILALAAALELIHTYSLIHDDLPAMDDDALRRGKPTCHIAFGEDVAILAGDGLYAEAFNHLLTHQSGEPRNVLAAATRLASATGVSGMVGGQYLDVAARAPQGPDGLRRLHSLKTGQLISASVVCVLELTGAESATIDHLEGFAGELGVLFQIVDDILDVTGSDEDLGKPQGSDAKHDKRTFVTEFGLDGARSLATESHARARAELAAAPVSGDRSRLEQLTDFIANRQF